MPDATPETPMTGHEPKGSTALASFAPDSATARIKYV